jgi:integrase
MAKGPKPFKYREKWRATVTLSNRTRPTRDFEKYDDAVQWIAEQLANADSLCAPELGGPTVATLADALFHYAGLYTVNKGGVVSELNRINHYLEAAGRASLKSVPNDAGGFALVERPLRALPSAFERHNQTRRTAREQTYARFGELAQKRCSVISTADIRRLVSDMQREGLSDSTIQKEVALLKHMFNMAAGEWNWKGFENPCKGIKLGKSEMRFVFISKEQRQALWNALAGCDNPYFWPLVEIDMQTTLRRASLLAMRWDQVDLDGRLVMVPSKSGQVAIPLTLHAVTVFKQMPRDDSGYVFPMSANAVDMAWDGVRVKAGVPKLQFRDLRHLAATDFARRGFNSHQLKKVLGHKTTFMADVYVNLVNQDVLDAMDSTQHRVPVLQLPPPATSGPSDIVNRRRADRLMHAVRSHVAETGSSKSAERKGGPAANGG